MIFVVAAVLTAGVVWAEETAVEPLLSGEALTEDALEGGGCMPADLAGLSEEEIEAAALAAGLGVEPTQAQAPACPVKFDCSSITNCGASATCSVTDIGPCCTTSSGLGLCCISGTIKVRRCPCQCTGNPCSITCAFSTDVKWRCR